MKNRKIKKYKYQKQNAFSFLKTKSFYNFTIISDKRRFHKVKKNIKNDFKNIIFIIFASTLIGFTNGFFGGGGGMLCVPLLEKCLKISNKKAHATTIAVIVPLSLVSSIIYFLKNDLDVFNLIYTSIGVFVGGALGAVLLKKFSGKVIRVIFAIIMLAAGIKMVI